MNKESFKELIRECLMEIQKENNKTSHVNGSFKKIVGNIINEIANVKTSKIDDDKDEVEKIRKGYSKDGNQREDKTNDKKLEELQSIVHNIDSSWKAYIDDYGQFIVRAQNQLYVRIVQKFENNYDIEAMVKLADRIRVIGLSWEQVKAFIKSNFEELKNTTKTDSLKQKAMDNKEDKDVIGKMAGPDSSVKTLRDKDNGVDSKIKSVPRKDKNYIESEVKREEDLPDQLMKQVVEPGKDPKSLNKNITRTPKVKPIKHEKSDTNLKQVVKKTPKFKEKNGD